MPITIRIQGHHLSAVSLKLGGLARLCRRKVALAITNQERVPLLVVRDKYVDATVTIKVTRNSPQALVAIGVPKVQLAVKFG